MKQRRWVFGGLVVAVVGLLLVPPQQAMAGQLSGRSLFIASSVPSATTTHQFSFTLASSSTVGSILFEYCTTPLFDEPCTPTPGVDVSAATLSAQTGETGFTVGLSTPARIVLTRTPQATSATQVSYTFSGAVNPPATTPTFFVRISTYASTDATGLAIDAGTVANSTAQTISLSTEVPPILNFCVALSISGDCSTATGDFMQLGNLATSQTASGTSQFWVGTNAQNGYSVSMMGTTMTSGTNTITALTTPTLTAPGNAQFGVNLRANTVPATGQDPAGPGPATPTADYNQPNRFTFRSGDTIAAAGIPADWQRFTVTYIVNITPVQPPGIYSTTLTYVCSAGF